MMTMCTNELTGFELMGTRILSLVILISFALIPVRCDASAMPHSIFMAPAVMTGADHSHHRTPTTATQSKTIPHHTPDMADTLLASHHQHDESTGSSQQTTGADAKSQQPVGAAFEVPVTSNTLDVALEQPLDREPVTVHFAPVVIPGGMGISPDSPPPERS